MSQLNYCRTLQNRGSGLHCILALLAFSESDLVYHLVNSTKSLDVFSILQPCEDGGAGEDECDH